jgi:ribosome-associated heat shock protein Hsp15
MRLDKWLWAARFFKTRSLAQKAIEGGKVRLNGDRPKTSRELRAGDRLIVSVGRSEWSIEVLALSDKRGPAAEAQRLYAEDAASRKQREEDAAKRRLMREPAGERHGRPTKRERRQLERFRDE